MPLPQCFWCDEYLAPRPWWRFWGDYVHSDGRKECDALDEMADRLIEIRRAAKEDR